MSIASQFAPFAQQANSTTVTLGNTTITDDSITIAGASGNVSINTSAVVVSNGAIHIGSATITEVAGIIKLTNSGGATPQSIASTNDVAGAITYTDTKAATAYSNAIAIASSDASSKAAVAYSNAVTAAASDATNKASQSYTNAVAYTDAQLVNKASLSGATFTGSVIVGNSQVTGTNLKTGGTITANGSNGTAGQVLTSGATGNAYWSTISAGATLNANNTDTQSFYIATSNAISGTWANAVVDTKFSYSPGQSLLKLGSGASTNGAWITPDYYQVGNSTVAAYIRPNSISMSAPDGVALSLHPFSNGATSSLGLSNARWTNVYANNGNFSGIVAPLANGQGLGSSTARWAASMTSIDASGIITTSTAVVPTSNSIGATLGQSTQRWNITGNNAYFSGNVVSLANGQSLGSTTQRWATYTTTIDAVGNTTIVGTAKANTTSVIKSAPSISAGTLTLNLASSAVFEVPLNANITTFTIQNIQSTGSTSSFVLALVADGTARTITWPTSFKWPAGVAPTLTSTNTKKDVFFFFTYDGGTTWQAFICGQNL